MSLRVGAEIQQATISSALPPLSKSGDDETQAHW